jgi:hypothetical protein
MPVLIHPKLRMGSPGRFVATTCRSGRRPIIHQHRSGMNRMLLLMLGSQWREKIHGFLEPEEDQPEHFAAIGRLVTAFNGIDVILNLILRSQLGVETKVGRAVIGGMRTGDMLSSLRRLARVQGKQTEWFEQFEDLRSDIQSLKNIRDDVAHKIWAVNERQMQFSNSYVAREDELIERTVYTVEEINELACYAPHLSERALDLFPGTVSPPIGKLPSRDKPARLQSQDQNRGKSRRS